MRSDTAAAEIVCANSPELMPPGGHYSHVCIAGGFVHVSGQLPINAEGRPLVDRSFSDQVRQVLANLDSCLTRAGTNRQRLIKVGVYITDMREWPEFNRLYAQWLGDHRPARCVAGVAELHFGAAVEVDAVALAAGEHVGSAS